MPKPILFSLPVHERPNIVKRQLANIRRFAPNALVCIHVSQSASREEFARLAQPGVLINSLSLPTVMHCGLMHVHVANFAYAVLCKETFGRMVFISSNELFIRPGVEDYINAHILGTQIEMLDPTADWQLFERGVEKDSRMAGLMKELNIPIFFGGQAEGQFYDFHLFAEICRLYGKHFGDPLGFATEECVPQTIAAVLMSEFETIALPFTFQNYSNDVEITPYFIQRIHAGRGCIFANKHPKTLRSPHIGRQVLDTIFSVKRIPREDCAIRSYIEKLPLKDGLADTNFKSELSTTTSAA